MAITFVLDTSAYSAFNRGDGRLRQWFQDTSQIIVPLVVVGELRAGFAAGNKREENELLLQRFLDAPNVSTATITDRTTKLFAQIYAKLRRAGTPIGTNDLWIAATTLEHDTSLLTLDSDFACVPDLLLAS
ncbi:MAG TPA: type II toxin-antitoxin system VapC family toxin [Candidatus Saccharimonadales bacterium]|nr:type II toxin-antitoxin system VapC family toxin [Candidatus Saccharimonadales bacterium]